MTPTARPDDAPLPYDAEAMRRLNAERNAQAVKDASGQRDAKRPADDYQVTSNDFLITVTRARRATEVQR